MRIVAWNCQMGFHKKIEAFSSLRSDLAVISEYSRQSALAIQPLSYTVLWFGSNPEKGLTLLCRDDWTLEAIQAPEQKWIVPIRVNSDFIVFTLMAVWACRVGGSKLTEYTGQVYQAMPAPLRTSDGSIKRYSTLRK